MSAASGEAATGPPVLDAFVPEYRPGDAPDPAALATAVRDYWVELRAHLEAIHRAGASGQEVNEANADGTDRLVRRLWQLAEARWFARGGEVGEPAAVLAVGGYARRELSIEADLDLLVLHQGEENPLAAFAAEQIQYVMWDARVDVALALRTVDETLDLARRDLSAFTSVLLARFLAGDPRLLHDLTTAVRLRLLDDPEAFVRRIEEGAAERHEKFGESLYLLQPNLKEGAGGLRDYHAACWVARAVDPLVVGRADFLHAGLLSELEMRALEAALQFLWRVRNDLHLVQGRKTDQMSFELQEVLAGRLGYAAEPPGSGPEEGAGSESAELPVERFMRDYYRHARSIQTFSEIIVEQCHARVRPDVPGPQVREVEDGFRVVGDQLHIPHAAYLRERPVRLLLAFAVAQDHDVALSRSARRLVRESLSLVDDDFRRDPEAASVFLRILGARYRVMRSLMAMNEVGLLGRFLPEWEHIVCRWQHVIYHTYTVDVHSIFLVEALRRLWRGKYEEEHPELTRLVRESPDLPTLFLGCLLHDIGKGFGGDHSNKGARRAEQLLARLGIAGERRDRIVFVVRHHLLMSHVSQRRDLSDPKVIVDFARVVGDRENLRNLYLATYADMRASSDTAFSTWRAGLLRELFERTSEFLEAGGDDPDRAIEIIDARVETRQEQARRELERAGVPPPIVVDYFEMMPRRYFVSHGPRQIARHAEVVLGFVPGNRPFATAVREMRGDFSEFILCARDVHRLYANVAGSLTAAGINILGSHVYTTRTGLALEVYRVTTPGGGPEERAEAWRGLEDILERVLVRGEPVQALLARRGRSVGQGPPPTPTPPQVVVRNDVSDFYTVVDVTADDRPGLLADLARTIADQDLEIFVSKATTVLDQVADTFYCKGPDAEKVTDPAALEALEAALWKAVGDRRGDAGPAEDARPGPEGDAAGGA